MTVEEVIRYLLDHGFKFNGIDTDRVVFISEESEYSFYLATNEVGVEDKKDSKKSRIYSYKDLRLGSNGKIYNMVDIGV